MCNATGYNPSRAKHQCAIFPVSIFSRFCIGKQRRSKIPVQFDLESFVAVLNEGKSER
jgi:hypothetical protein